MKIDKNKVVKKLEELGAVNPCPRCGNQRFDYVGVSALVVDTEDYSDLKYRVPVAVVACSNCACIYQHALIALGITPAEDEDS